MNQIDEAQKILRLNALGFSNLTIAWKSWKEKAKDQRRSGKTNQEPSDA